MMKYVEPRLLCRQHGEMLVRSEMLLRWQCPERRVCGTFVDDDYYVAHVAHPRKAATS